MYCVKVVNTVTTALYDTAYNSSVHKFFRIRQASGIVYWDYSTDGTAWTNMYSEAAPIDTSQLLLEILAGFYDDDTNPTTAIFDHVNTDASGDRTGTQVISPISSYNLPRRPIRLYGGFGNIKLPQ